MRMWPHLAPRGEYFCTTAVSSTLSNTSSHGHWHRYSCAFTSSTTWTNRSTHHNISFGLTPAATGTGTGTAATWRAIVRF
eukprot:8173396-Pyramimonas_sp.AAC.1